MSDAAVATHRPASVLIFAVPVLLAVSFAVPLALALHHFAVVPAIVNEVNRDAAGLVAVAVFVPLLAVARRHPKIDRLLSYAHWPHQHRLRHDDLRLRKSPDVDASVNAGLGNADRYANINVGRLNRCVQGDEQREQGWKSAIHLMS